MPVEPTGQQQASQQHTLPPSDTVREGVLNGQKVTTAQPEINIPKSSAPKGIALHDRKVGFRADIKEGYIARFKAWVSGQPTPWQKTKIDDLTRNLVASIGQASGEAVDSSTLFNSKGFKANKYTWEQKAGMILVEAGLAEVRTNENHQLEFTYKRPYDLKQQIMGAELLFETVPVRLTKEGSFDWNKIYDEVAPQKINDLRLAGLCPFSHDSEAVRTVNVTRTPSPFTYPDPDQPWETSNEAGRFWADMVKLLASEAPPEFQRMLDTLSQVFGQFYDGRSPKPDALEATAQLIEERDQFIAAELRLAAKDFQRFFGHMPDWFHRSPGG